MLKAIAFDLDGTLVDSVIDLANAANVVRVKLGKPELVSERVRQFVGDGVAQLLQRSLTDDMNGQLEPATLELALETFHAYYGDHLAENTRPYAGVALGLQRLQQLQVPMAIVTNKPEHHTHALLAALQLDRYFKAVIGGDTLSQRKPNAAPLLEAAQRLEVDLNEILMVGDSPNDVLCARAAGAKVWVVDYGYADAATLNADKVIHHLGEIADGFVFTA